MIKTNEVVVSLKRGVTLQDVGVTGTATLAQFLNKIADLEVVEELPTGKTAVIRIDEGALQKLRVFLGEKCHIVGRTRGRVYG